MNYASIIAVFFCAQAKKTTFPNIFIEKKPKTPKKMPKNDYSGHHSQGTSVRAPVVESIIKPRTVTSRGIKGWFLIVAAVSVTD